MASERQAHTQSLISAVLRLGEITDIGIIEPFLGGIPRGKETLSVVITIN